MIREFAVNLLKPIPCLPCAILHKSGNPLWLVKETVTAEGISCLRQNGVESVFFVSADESLADVRHRFCHDIIPVDQLHPGETLASPILDADGKLLFEANRPIPESLPRALTRRDVKTVMVRKTEEVLEEKKAETLRKSLEEIAQKVDSAASSGLLRALKEEDLPENTVEAVRKKSRKTLMTALETEGQAFMDFLDTPTDKTLPVTEEVKEFCHDMIAQSLEHIQYLFDQVQRNRRIIEVNLAEKTIQNIMSGLIRNRDLLMFTSTDHGQYEYLVSHALATAVIASNISINLGFDAKQVRVIVYGGMLADIGMLRVPESIRNKKEPLTSAEYAEIRRHPGYGMDMLEHVANLPEEVKYIVYQTHERVDGSGYPHGKKGVVIHPYAQIVSIADMYSSIITPRPFRDAESPYKGMEKLVLMCGKRQINAEYIRGFLKCNSMFPVGSFLQLSDGRVARVVAPSESDYMRPIVSVLSDAQGSPVEEYERLMLDQHSEVHIISSLERSQLPFNADMAIGF